MKRRRFLGGMGVVGISATKGGRVLFMFPSPTDLLTYDQCIAAVDEFLAGARGRYRFEGETRWGRWRQPARFLVRVRSEIEAMAVGHPWFLLQRESDREQASIEKVSEDPP